jgi:IS5 family transposase
MIVDRYPENDFFALVPTLLRRTDPVLEQLDRLLDDDALVAAVRADLVGRFPHSARQGRPSTPVEVLLRMLVVRRLYDWSYEETEARVSDSLSLRQFCRLGVQAAPDDTTLIRWAACIRPATMEALHARVVELARAQQVTAGRRFRIDGTVVETTIHYPSDSSLLADAGRMLGRLLRRARAVLGADAPASLFRDWTTSTKRLARRIGETTRRGGEEGRTRRTATYHRLLTIIRIVQQQADAVQARLATAGKAGDRLRTQLNALLPLVEQVVEQTVRRLAGETVPAREKIVSLVESHTAIIRRDKPRQQTEFGHKLLLGEVEGGIISSYQILEGNAGEAAHLIPHVVRQRDHFGHMPTLVAADRGFHAPGTEAALHDLGVTRVVIPAQGRPPPDRQVAERSRWFRRGHRFRAGIEGRISVCKRRGWLGRCRDHGADGFARWIGWGVIANNLVAIARHHVGSTHAAAA